MANYGLQQIFEESVSQTTATASVELGTKRFESGKDYMYVYNMATSTATCKYGVVASAASAYSVTISSLIGNFCMGVVHNTDIEPANYGWVVTRGYVDLYSSGNSAIALHNAIIMDANGTFTRTSSDSGATGVIIGAATEATTTAGTFNAYVNCG